MRSTLVALTIISTLYSAFVFSAPCEVLGKVTDKKMKLGKDNKSFCSAKFSYDKHKKGYKFAIEDCSSDGFELDETFFASEITIKGSKLCLLYTDKSGLQGFGKYILFRKVDQKKAKLYMGFNSGDLVKDVKRDVKDPDSSINLYF